MTDSLKMLTNTQYDITTLGWTEKLFRSKLCKAELTIHFTTKLNGSNLEILHSYDEGATYHNLSKGVVGGNLRRDHSYSWKLDLADWLPERANAFRIQLSFGNFKEIYAEIGKKEVN